MKLLGLNVDPLRSDHKVDEVVATGTQAVRLVLRPGLQGVCRTYQARDVVVLGVIARESVSPFPTWSEAADQYQTWFDDVVDYWQIGNEPDTSGESSWTMTQAEFRALRGAFEECRPTIGPGLASGHTTWMQSAYMTGLVAICPHYPQTSGKIREYQRFGKPVWVTEGFHDEDIIRECFTDPITAAYFAWWHSPTPDLGISHVPARIAAFKRLVKEFNMPAPQFVLGFKTYAQQHPEVGDPVEDEWTERKTPGTVQRQDTTGGVLRYYGQSNQIVFSPKE